MSCSSPSPRIFVADDKFGDAIAALQARGWRRYPHTAYPGFDLKWSNYSQIAWPRVRPHQRVNHFQHAVLWSRKDRMAQCLAATISRQEMDTLLPRTIVLDTESSMQRLALWVLYSRAVGVLLRASAVAVDRERVDVDSNAIATAMRFAQRVLACETFFTEGMDQNALAEWDLMGLQWQSLLQEDASGSGERMASASDPPMPPAASIRDVLEALEHRDPQWSMLASGAGNVWICKPCNLSRGRGIQLATSLASIQAIVSTMEQAEQQGASSSAMPDAAAVSRASWVVQKYIERPLLLQHGRKFDLRQWVLITSLDPLHVYWHEHCYLRFCSAPFSLQTASLQDAFMHLSNFSIQQYATASADTSSGSGYDAMWSSAQFAEWLIQQHGRDMWKETIEPQMQRAAMAAIRAVVPHLRTVGRGFEWLGLDFLVDETLRAWLLEVNVSPDVSHSTSVTAAMLPTATRDALTLILDSDSEASAASTANVWRRLADGI